MSLVVAQQRSSGPWLAAIAAAGATGLAMLAGALPPVLPQLVAQAGAVVDDSCCGADARLRAAVRACLERHRAGADADAAGAGRDDRGVDSDLRDQPRRPANARGVDARLRARTPLRPAFARSARGRRADDCRRADPEIRLVKARQSSSEFRDTATGDDPVQEGEALIPSVGSPPPIPPPDRWIETGEGDRVPWGWLPVTPADEQPLATPTSGRGLEVLGAGVPEQQQRRASAVDRLADRTVPFQLTRRTRPPSLADGDTEARNNLGTLLEEEGRLENALTQYQGG